jgi:hypothetical protein
MHKGYMHRGYMNGTHVQEICMGDKKEQGKTHTWENRHMGNMGMHASEK